MKRSTVDIRNRPRIPIPDEDPYSVAGNGGGSSGSSGGGGSLAPVQHGSGMRRSDKPPKLPPRDSNNPYPHDIPKVIILFFIFIKQNLLYFLISVIGFLIKCCFTLYLFILFVNTYVF